MSQEEIREAIKQAFNEVDLALKQEASLLDAVTRQKLSYDRTGACCILVLIQGRVFLQL